MVDKHIETFICVADAGSFLKAADKLFISSNAVIKQINLLESRLQLKLFERSAQGVRLTGAGKLIYDEGKRMIHQADAVLAKARELECPKDVVIRIGVSQMNPANILLEQWSRASSAHPNIKLKIVPFEDTVQGFTQLLSDIGRRVDVVACPYQTDYWGEMPDIRALYLTDLPFCIGCSARHPLAAKEKLTLSDLSGETVILLNRDDYNDELRALIKRPELNIQTVEVPYYDIDTFNQVATSRQLILTAACWKDVHPLIVTLPVSWPYAMPYGLLYAKNVSKTVLQFILALGAAA